MYNVYFITNTYFLDVCKDIYMYKSSTNIKRYFVKIMIIAYLFLMLNSEFELEALNVS